MSRKFNYGRKPTGFTIVELLMSIVIIGVLATITVVSYNLVQKNAQDAAWQDAVDGWEKAIRLEFSRTHMVPGAAWFAPSYCLGNAQSNFPAITSPTNMGAGVCEIQSGNVNTTASYDQNFIDQFKTKADFPKGNLPIFKATANGTTRTSRGIVVYVAFDGTSTYTITLYWKNNKPNSCARGVDGAGGMESTSTCSRTFTLN